MGVVPVQSDLCLAATLGLDHVERNGHHYHPGLNYLPADRQRQALAAHPDFYGKTGSIIGPKVRAGQFEIGVPAMRGLRLRRPAGLERLDASRPVVVRLAGVGRVVS